QEQLSEPIDRTRQLAGHLRRFHKIAAIRRLPVWAGMPAVRPPEFTFAPGERRSMNVARLDRSLTIRTVAHITRTGLPKPIGKRCAVRGIYCQWGTSRHRPFLDKCRRGAKVFLIWIYGFGGAVRERFDLLIESVRAVVTWFALLDQ
ncbi:MAG: hypothetical protein ACRD7E_04310, partial [Bryobacteraceae bacterium]